jgi:catechol 2,3-dioxygenase-like lactoylglutathione lyase family enzyme
MDLDHVAIATNDVSEVLGFLVGELGAPVLFGGLNVGFRAMQLEPGGLRIELLEPHNVEVNDFLHRFLQRSGEGPHHLTFKTDNIEHDLERAAAAGYEPVGVNIGNAFWREAFILPKQAGGTVVQLAESAFDPMEFKEQIDQMTRQRNEDGLSEMGVARWWPDPPPRPDQVSTLDRVVMATTDASETLRLYRDLLDGKVTERGEGWLELGWPGGGHIRFEEGGPPPGIDRLEWTHEGPAKHHVVAGTKFVLRPDAT